MSISPSKHNCFKICERCHDMPQFALIKQPLPQFYLQYWLGQLMTTQIPIVQFWQLLKSIYHYHILNWGFEELWHCCSIQYLMVYNGEEYFYSCMILHRKFTYKLYLTESRKTVFIMKHWLCQVQSQIIFLNVEGHKTMSARKWLMGFTVQRRNFISCSWSLFSKVCSSKTFKI